MIVWVTMNYINLLHGMEKGEMGRLLSRKLKSLINHMRIVKIFRLLKK